MLVFDSGVGKELFGIDAIRQPPRRGPGGMWPIGYGLSGAIPLPARELQNPMSLISQPPQVRAWLWRVGGRVRVARTPRAWTPRADSGYTGL